MRDFPILVYGATGYTGRLICDELLRSGATFAIGGRDQARLAALQQHLGLPAQAVLCADTGDPTALLGLAQRAQVVLSCAGPFVVHGPPALEAALRAGSHYLDITGEYDYMLATYKRDAEARERGVALVNAVGFDVVPTDAAAVLASEGLDRVDTVRIAFATHGGGGLSQGTLRSVLQAPRSGMAYLDGAWTPEPPGHHQWEVEMPAPLGHRRCLSVPWGDVATGPRSTGARNLRVYLALPPALLPLLRLGLPLLRLLSHPLLSHVVQRGVRLLPEGPTPQMRERSRSVAVAEAVGATGERRQAWVQAGDGYSFTAASAALCALLAAAPGFAARGALTPTQAFGARALLDGLRAHGVSYGTGGTHGPAAATEA